MPSRLLSRPSAPLLSTIEHLVCTKKGTVAEWPIGGLSGHMGSHIKLGVGHNDNWTELPDGMLGIWDMPLQTYFGEAVVFMLDNLKGQPILPKHLANVKEGDIVLLGSKWSGEDQPWICLLYTSPSPRD